MSACTSTRSPVSVHADPDPPVNTPPIPASPRRPPPDEAVVILVDSMLEAPRDEMLQLRAMISLMRMSTDPCNCRLLGHSGCIQTCLHAMRNFPHNGHITKAGCMFLANICFSCEENKGRVRELRGIQFALRMMTHLEDDEEFQNWACLLLRNLTSESQESQVMASQAGVLEVLHRTLKRFDWNSSLQVHGIATVGNIACVGLHCQMEVREKGCIELVVDAMRRHVGNDHVQRHCITAMKNICMDNGRNQRVFKELGSIDLLTELMRKCGSNARLMVHACHTLRYMCFEEGVRDMVGKNGALILMTEWLERISVEVGGAGVAVVLKAVSNATFSPDENKQIVARCGGLEQVMNVLNVHKDDCDVVDAGLRVFRNMSDMGGVNCQMLADNDVYCYAYGRVEKFEGHESIFEHYLAMVTKAVSVSYDEERVGIGLEALTCLIDDRLGRYANNVEVHKLGRSLKVTLEDHAQVAQEAANRRKKSKSLIFRLKKMTS